MAGYKMTARGKRRMLKLADELERCSRGRVLTIPGDGNALFNMETVMDGALNGDDERADEREWNPAPKGCGSTCCAMGFAGVHPWFNKQGLEFRQSLARKNGPCNFYVDGKSRYGDGFVEAAEKFFDINYLDAGILFTPDTRVVDGELEDIDETPKQVARRLRKFVKEHA
jgi:hypothetical protein